MLRVGFEDGPASLSSPTIERAEDSEKSSRSNEAKPPLPPRPPPSSPCPSPFRPYPSKQFLPIVSNPSSEPGVGVRARFGELEALEGGEVSSRRRRQRENDMYQARWRGSAHEEGEPRMRVGKRGRRTWAHFSPQRTRDCRGREKGQRDAGRTKGRRRTQTLSVPSELPHIATLATLRPLVPTTAKLSLTAT